MRITEKTSTEFPLFDDFLEVLNSLKVDKNAEFCLSINGNEVVFGPGEWNWFLKAAEKGWKLL